MDEKKLENILVTVLRLLLGWIFLWAFLDKAFGITKHSFAKGWLGGASPTTGFLKGTAGNALGAFYSSLAGSPIVDFLFMAALFGLAISLILGIGRKIAAVSGALLMLLMWSAELPNIANNPFVDDHLIYAMVFLIVGFTSAKGISFIPQWKKVAARYPVLE